jgi:hypothetical protein
MNAERRPGSSTSLRLMRPRRSSVSQQPLMLSISIQTESSPVSSRRRRLGS